MQHSKVVEPSWTSLKLNWLQTLTEYRNQMSAEVIVSAKEAMSAGADILVIGRPITKAKDPAKAAEDLLQEIM